MRRFLPALLVLLAACAGNPARRLQRHVVERRAPDGRVLRTYDAYVALPRGYHDPARAAERWPLLLYLPGMLTFGNDRPLPLRGGPPLEVERGRDLPCVLYMPTTPTFLERWTPELVIGHVDHALRTWRVDPKRVIVTGVSIGGMGAWDVAQAFPDRIAAVVPVAAWGTPWGIERMVDVPVWAFHGGLDFAIPQPFHGQMVKALRDAGGNPRYTVIRGGFHWIWDEVYARDDLYAWMLAQRRP